MSPTQIKPTKLLLAGIAVLFAHSTNAATINVPGTQPTIAAGIAAAVAGDTVSIAPGTYFEEGLTIDKQLTLKGSAKTVIDAGQIPDPNGGSPIPLIHGTTHAIVVAANDVNIQGLTILNARNSSNGIRINNGFTGVTISKVNIRNTGGHCIATSGGNTNLTVTGSSLLDCGNDGINANGDTITISKNILYHLDNGGIIINGNGATVLQNQVSVAADDDLIYVSGDSALVTQNKVYNSDDYGIQVVGQNPVITLNYAEGIYDEGIYVTCNTDCSKAQVTKNKLYNVGQNEGDGIQSQSSADGMLIAQNMVNVTNETSIYVTDSNNAKTTIDNNKLSNAGAEEDCIYATGGPHVISNNKIDSCRISGISARSAGIEVVNNTITNTGKSGVFARNNDVNVHNNKISNTTGFGVITDINRTGIKITNNAFKFNRNQICDASPNSTTISGNTGTGSVWKVGTTFGTGGDNCDFL